MNKLSMGLGLALALAACARGAEPVEPVSSGVPGAIALRDPGGRLLANATVSANGGVRVRVEAAGLVAGTYAIHFHEFGLCEAAGLRKCRTPLESAGRQHGRLNPLGPHLGDMPNLNVGAGGAGVVEFAIPAASLRGGSRALLDRDGAALVIHVAPDDYRTDPSGNSGAPSRLRRRRRTA